MVVGFGAVIAGAWLGFKIGSALLGNYLANRILAEHSSNREDDMPDLRNTSEGGPSLYLIGKECRVRGQLLWMSHIFEDGSDQVVNVAVGVSHDRIESIKRIYAEGYEIYNSDGTVTVGPIADTIGIRYQLLGDWVATIESSSASYDMTVFRPGLAETITLTGFSDNGNLWGSGGGTAGNEKGEGLEIKQYPDGTSYLRAKRKDSTVSPVTNQDEAAAVGKTITVQQVIPTNNPDFVTETAVYRGDPGQVWSPLVIAYETQTKAEGTVLIDDATVNINDTTVHMDGFTTKPESGDVFEVTGDTQRYTVSSSTALVGTDSDVTFSPGAKVAWADNTAVTFQHVVPAFEQTAYFTLEKLILTQFGNRLPALVSIVEQDDDDVTVGAAIDLILGWAGWTNDSESGLYWDTSALDSATYVTGYTMTGTDSVEARLEALRIAYDVVAQARDGVVHFFHPEDARIWAVPAADFGVGEGEAEAPGLRVTLESEASLPSQVTVRFIDPDNDWEDAAIDAHRTFPNVDSEVALEIDLSSLVLTFDEARVIAERLLWRPWNHRRKVEATMPPRYVDILENDKIETTHNGETVQILVERLDRGANGVLELRGSIIEELA